jgi:hypothetical protein
LLPPLPPYPNRISLQGINSMNRIISDSYISANSNIKDSFEHKETNLLRPSDYEYYLNNHNFNNSYFDCNYYCNNNDNYNNNNNNNNKIYGDKYKEIKKKEILENYEEEIKVREYLHYCNKGFFCVILLIVVCLLYSTLIFFILFI